MYHHGLFQLRADRQLARTEFPFVIVRQIDHESFSGLRFLAKEQAGNVVQNSVFNLKGTYVADRSTGEVTSAFELNYWRPFVPAVIVCVASCRAGAMTDLQTV